MQHFNFEPLSTTDETQASGHCNQPYPIHFASKPRHQPAVQALIS
jgi:hypothetical protein